MISICVIDDNASFRRKIKKRLASHEYHAIDLPEGSTIAETMLAGRTPLAVMRHCSPAEPVLKMVRNLKKDRRLSGIMVMLYSSELTATTEVIKAFEAGVDDYLVYPFDWRVFLARVKALLRRTTFRAGGPHWIHYENIRINPDARITKVNGRTIELTPKEFGLLCLLVERKGSVLDRAFLMEQIWEYSYFGTTRTVDKHVENLRHKLGKAGRYIQTVERVGYKIA